MGWNDTTITAETHAVLIPAIRVWGGKKHVEGLRVDRVRTGKPSLARGEIAVKLRLTFDKQALIDAIPVVDIKITGFSVGTDAPEVEAVPA